MPRNDDFQDTRARLIAAGLELFGRHGFEGVTTRALATAAGVNQAAIPYHFGGKEGVFVAVAQRACDIAGADSRTLVESARSQLGAAPGLATAEAVLVDLAANVCRMMLTADSPAARFVFVNREQTEPATAFELLYEHFFAPLHRLVAELLAMLAGEAPEAAPAIMLAHSFLGQILVFAAGQASLQRRLGTSGDYTPGQIEEIVAAVSRISRLTVAGLRSTAAVLT